MGKKQFGGGHFLVDDSKLAKSVSGAGPGTRDEIVPGMVLLVRFLGLKGTYRMVVEKVSHDGLHLRMLSPSPRGRKWALRGLGYGTPATTGNVALVTTGGGRSTLRFRFSDRADG